MKFRPSYILVVLLLLVVGCGHRQKMISRSDMVDIISEMLMTDQAIREDRDLKRIADTSLVYEGIFEKYGYTTDDYLYSVSRYMRSPDKFSKMAKTVGKRFDAEAAKIQKQLDFIEKVDRLRGVEGVPVDSLLMRFSSDSFFYGRPKIVVDPLLVISFREQDSLPSERDSLLFAADSLTIATDSLTFAADSTAIREVTDSLQVEKEEEL